MEFTEENVRARAAFSGFYACAIKGRRAAMELRGIIEELRALKLFEQSDRLRTIAASLADAADYAIPPKRDGAE